MVSNIMQRILHLIHTPRQSGAEILVRDLCIKHNDYGINSGVASFSPMEEEFEPEADLLRKVGSRLFFPTSSLAKLGRISHYKRAIKEFSPDVVFAHSVLPSFYGRLAMPALKKSRPRFVSVLHSASNDDYKGGLLRLFEHTTRGRVDHVIAVSEVGARNYARRFGTQIPIEIIPNGINLNKYRDVNRQKARDSLGLKDDVKIVLQVGRIAPVKQQILSINVLADVLKNEKVELWFAGLTEDAEYEAKAKLIINEAGLQNKVKFLGSRDDIPVLLSAADLYLMPSAAEAHSIALIEALASGIEAVISDIPTFHAYRDWVGVSSIAVSDLTYFKKICEQKLKCESKRFSRCLSEFSIENTADAYKSFLTHHE
jgi:glycosyltransferase involved in cell wall biosynthesis